MRTCPATPKRGSFGAPSSRDSMELAAEGSGYCPGDALQATRLETDRSESAEC